MEKTNYFIRDYEAELKDIVRAIQDNFNGRKPKLKEIIEELNPLYCGYTLWQCRKLRAFAHLYYK